MQLLQFICEVMKLKIVQSNRTTTITLFHLIPGGRSLKIDCAVRVDKIGCFIEYKIKIE